MKKVVLVEVSVLHPGDGGKDDGEIMLESENYIRSLIGRPDPKRWVQMVEATEIVDVR